jgi:hypothetical protein
MLSVLTDVNGHVETRSNPPAYDVVYVELLDSEISKSRAAATTVPATTVPATTLPVASTVPPVSSSLAKYESPAFSIEYPAGWVVSHISVGAGNRDSTFQPASGNDGLLIRVDEDLQSNETLSAGAAPVIAALNKEPTYRLVSLTDTSFMGFPALRWEFVDTEGGIPLHKVDTFFIDGNGRGWAVLVQTPQSVWAQEGELLEADQNTLILASLS